MESNSIDYHFTKRLGTAVRLDFYCDIMDGYKKVESLVRATSFFVIVDFVIAKADILRKIMVDVQLVGTFTNRMNER